MKFYYVTIDYVLELHDSAIEKSGGLIGVKDVGILESILEHIQNDDYYPELEDKTCHLFYAINKSHAFNDGNKRASITATAYFLQINGYGALSDSFIRTFENIAVYVAENRIDKNFLRDMLSSFLYEDGFNEQIQLRLLRLLDQ